jgi:hypothetical protein
MNVDVRGHITGQYFNRACLGVACEIREGRVRTARGCGYAVHHWDHSPLFDLSNEESFWEALWPHLTGAKPIITWALSL